MYVQHLPRIGRSDHQCLLIVRKENEKTENQTDLKENTANERH
jgi:hypothetical protein